MYGEQNVTCDTIIIMWTHFYKSTRTGKRSIKNDIVNGSFLNFKILLFLLECFNNRKQKIHKTWKQHRVWVNHCKMIQMVWPGISSSSLSFQSPCSPHPFGMLECGRLPHWNSFKDLRVRGRYANLSSPQKLVGNSQCLPHQTLVHTHLFQQLRNVSVRMCI